MTSVPFTPVRIDRRSLLGGLGAATLIAPQALAQQAGAPSPSLVLRARPATRSIAPDGPPSELWELITEPAAPPLTFRRGERIGVTFHNGLPVPSVLNWRGVYGAAAAEPLIVRPAVPPGGADTFTLEADQAWTMMCDARLLGDGQARASNSLSVIVRPDRKAETDRDEVMLIEDWRRAGDGGFLAPGHPAAADAALRYTVNGKPDRDLTLRPQERLRICFMNGCHRAVIAIRISDYQIRVIDIDGRPAEPFTARDGQIILAPGTRLGVLLDATLAAGSGTPILLYDGAEPRTIGRLRISPEAPLRTQPLPDPPATAAEGLPDRLDLKNALRVQIDLDRAPIGGWALPARFGATASPAFQVKRNRTVVLALTNRASIPVTFHLHGHHARLLDRLDDGWKPFWLDTLAIGPGQTQRLAFQAAHGGRWLMEALAADWAAPRQLHSYAVS